VAVRDDGNGRPPLDQDEVVRVPVELLAEPGVTAAPIRVYAPVRRRIGFEPAADNFLIAWPSVATIASETGLNRTSVIRALRWLEDRDYVLRDRRPNRSSVYTVIVWRSWFQELVEMHGRAEAIRLLRKRMEEAGDASRRGQARTAGRANRPSGTDFRPEVAPVPPTNPEGWPGCDRPGGLDATDPVASTPPRSVDQGICGSENRGAPTGAPLSVVPTADSEEERLRVQREGLAMVRTLAKEKEWSERR